MKKKCYLYGVVLGLLIGACTSSTAKKKEHKADDPDTISAVVPATVAASAVLPMKYIYLTFDDGPLNGSEHIDSVVLAEQLKVNVFVVGMYMHQSKLLQRYFKLYKENPFIEIYNHSYTHAHDKYELFYRDPENVLADIRKNESEFDLRFKIVRLPGRNMWRIGNRKRDDEKSGSAAADLLAANGYKLFGWDLEWDHDLKNGDPIQSVGTMVKEIEAMFKYKRSFTPGHVVILAHDEMFRKKWEESELKQLIDTLKTQHYVFEHIRFYPLK